MCVPRISQGVLKSLLIIFSAFSLISCTKKAPEYAGRTLPLKIISNPNENYGSIEGFDIDNPSNKIVFENVNGVAIIDGDIALGKIDQLESMLRKEFESREIQKSKEKNGNRGLLATSTTVGRGLWPNAKVPYQFGKSVPAGIRQIAKAAMDEYNKRTVVKFEEIPEGTQLPFNALKMRLQVMGRKDDQCGDFIGYPALAGTVGPSPGASNICMGPNVSHSIMLHELGHILGFYHEHQRPDRDNFLTVEARPARALNCAIANGAYGKNDPSKQGFFNYFQFGTTAIGPYDFGSIMHYPLGGSPTPLCDRTFGGYGIIDLLPKRGLKKGTYAGGRGSRGLSAQDILNINLLYTGKAISAPFDLKVEGTSSHLVRLSLRNVAGDESKANIEYTEAGTENWRIGQQTDLARSSFSNNYTTTIDVLGLTPDTNYEFRAFTSKPHPEGTIESQRTQEISVKTRVLPPPYRLTVNVSGLVEGESGVLNLKLNPANLAGFEIGTETFTVTTNGAHSFDRNIGLDTPLALTSDQSKTPVHRRCVLSVLSRNEARYACPTGYLIGGTVLGVSDYVTISNGFETTLAKGKYQFPSIVRHGATANFSVLEQPRGYICTFPTATRVVSAPSTDNNVSCVKKTYTVSGTIAGLTGSVSIQLNGQQESTFTTDGPFTFPKGLTQGTHYEVQISKQPATKYCALNNHTGKMGEENITGVSIRCSSILVGGKITGAPSPITISNGTETLSAQGTYQFQTEFPNGATANFSVLTQPEGYICNFKFPTPVLTSSITNNDITCTKIPRFVSGTISGLTEQVSLRLTGNNDLPINSDGPFSFPVGIIPPANYRLTVSRQPVGQLCTVRNGEGQMPEANITNVSVTCVVRIYKVKIFISGVRDKSGLHVVNGDEALPFINEGSGYFSLSLLNGQSYNIRLLENPPLKTCTIGRNSGIIQNADVQLEFKCSYSPIVMSGTPGNKAKQHIYYEFQPTLSNLPPEGLSFSVTNKPSWLGVDQSTGKIFGYPDKPGVFSNFTLVASIRNGDSVPDTNSQLGPFSIEVTGDPLLSEAWYFKNNGQTSFAKSGSPNGHDMAILDGLSAKPGTFLTGRGVQIGIIGSGIDRDHEDLKENILLSSSVDYRTNKSTRQVPDQSSTTAAGIIAAVGWNSIGTRGIAPYSKLMDLNAYHTEVNPEFQQSALIDAISKTPDIFLHLGTRLNSENLEFKNASTSVIQALETSVGSARGGKGAVHILPSSSNDAFFKGIDSAYNELANNPYIIATASTNAAGYKSSTSGLGTNIWVSGSGGETGLNPASDVRPETIRDLSKFLHPVYLFSPGIISTDITGCELGNSRRISTSFSLFDFDSGKSVPHSQNVNCNYTNSASNQESAAATVAGVVALMLEANPELSWRDIKFILASTASQISNLSSGDRLQTFRANGYKTLAPGDSSQDPSHMASLINSGRNSAGFIYNNVVGFGRVNAKNAIEKATANYRSPFKNPFVSTIDSNGQSRYSSGPLQIPISSGRTGAYTFSPTGERVLNASAVHKIRVPESMIIEGVQIKVSVDHPFVGDLGIILSKNGVRSVLLNRGGFNPINPSGFVPNLQEQVFYTNTFYQMDSSGDWTLEIVNSGAHQAAGQLTNWKIDFFGQNR